ncbi:hypothetical protein IWQ62_005183, partial [Dispira parvispora]
MASQFFKGASSEQDTRFSDKTLKLRKSLKFPPEFSQKVSMNKVNMTVIRPWVTRRVTELLGLEDEVVLEYIFSMLEEDQPDPVDIQINLTGFLENKAGPFVQELWQLLLSAQSSIGGIPPVFLEQKKQEIQKQLADHGRIQTAIIRERTKRL